MSLLNLFRLVIVNVTFLGISASAGDGRILDYDAPYKPETLSLFFERDPPIYPAVTANYGGHSDERGTRNTHCPSAYRGLSKTAPNYFRNNYDHQPQNIIRGDVTDFDYPGNVYSGYPGAVSSNANAPNYHGNPYDVDYYHPQGVDFGDTTAPYVPHDDYPQAIYDFDQTTPYIPHGNYSQTINGFDRTTPYIPHDDYPQTIDDVDQATFYVSQNILSNYSQAINDVDQIVPYDPEGRHSHRSRPIAGNNPSIPYHYERNYVKHQFIPPIRPVHPIPPPPKDQRPERLEYNLNKTHLKSLKPVTEVLSKPKKTLEDQRREEGHKWILENSMKTWSRKLEKFRKGSISFSNAVFSCRGTRRGSGPLIWGSADNHRIFAKASRKELFLFKFGEGTTFTAWEDLKDLQSLRSKYPGSWSATISLKGKGSTDITENGPFQFHVLRKGVNDPIPLKETELHNGDKLIITPEGYQEGLSKLASALKDISEPAGIKFKLEMIFERTLDTLIGVVLVKAVAENPEVVRKGESKSTAVELSTNFNWRSFKDLQVFSRRFKIIKTDSQFIFGAIASRKLGVKGSTYLIGKADDNLFLQVTSKSLIFYKLKRDADEFPPVVSSNKICEPENEYSIAWATSITNHGAFQRCGAEKDDGPNLFLIREELGKLTLIDQEIVLKSDDIVFAAANGIKEHATLIFDTFKEINNINQLKPGFQEILSKFQELDTIFGIVSL